MLEHEAHAVVVEIFEVGLQDMEIGEGVPHIAELHHIVPDIDVGGEDCPVVHIFAKRGFGRSGGDGFLTATFDGAEHDVDVAVGLLNMSVHGLGCPAGELIGKGGDGLVGETARYLIDEMDKCATGTAIERVHVAATGALADVVVVVIRHRPYLSIGLVGHHLGKVGAEGV